MKVDGANADGAAARQRDSRLPEARHQRSQHQHRGPHLLDQFIRRHGIEQLAGFNLDAVAVASWVTEESTPRSSSRLRSVLMSRTRGILCRITRWSVSSAAVNAGNAAFLAPLMTTRPSRGRPPVMRNLSIKTHQLNHMNHVTSIPICLMPSRFS